jgi:hypothetical protein
MGLWIAFRLRANFAAILMAGIDLFLGVEFAFHSTGHRSTTAG